MLQLADESEMEMVELLRIVGWVADDVGKLVVANELVSHDGCIVASALGSRNHGV
jgi:hypothetical protein